MTKMAHVSTRNMVETAIDASKADKTSSWESLAKKLYKNQGTSGKACEVKPKK